MTGAIGNIQISRDKLTPLKPIGQGQFGFVYMAHQQMLSGDRETRACAATALDIPFGHFELGHLVLLSARVRVRVTALPLCPPPTARSLFVCSFWDGHACRTLR